MFLCYVGIPWVGLKNHLLLLRRPQRQTPLMIYSDDVHSQMPSKYSTSLLEKNKAGFLAFKNEKGMLKTGGWKKWESNWLCLAARMQGFGRVVEVDACHLVWPEHSFIVYKEAREPLASPPPLVFRHWRLTKTWRGKGQRHCNGDPFKWVRGTLLAQRTTRCPCMRNVKVVGTF